MQTSLSFHGAAGQVTGSCHLLVVGGKRILVDCGLFQGAREIEEENRQPFGFEPSSIDFLLLTHAHLDHCGRIPLLVKQGFRGEIITTAATRELARLIMLDAAHLEEEEAERRQRHASRRNASAAQPLYTMDDALYAMDFFGRTVRYGTPLYIADHLSVTFIDAGHILGSAGVVVEFGTGAGRRRIVFSGDLGNPGRPVLKDPDPPPAADYVVIETTYGDRQHRSLPDSVEELYQAITSTLERGGNVIIPTFALERTQEILYYLRAGIEDHRLPRHLTVFLDSPMAISATEIFRRHTECFSESFRNELKGRDPFALPGLRFTRDKTESMAINNVQGGAVILAGSGMCDGGRVRHHLRHSLWREQNGIVFVGFAAQGTLARRIIDGAESVRLFQEEIRVRARIWTVNGFSAHADQAGLLAWLGHAGNPRQVFLVHGEPDRGMAAFARELAGRNRRYHIPHVHERIMLE